MKAFLVLVSFAVFIFQGESKLCFWRLNDHKQAPVRTEFLGEGNTAKVYLYEYADGRQEAVKIYHLGWNRQDEDIKSQSYLERILKGSNIGVAHYEKIPSWNPFSQRKTRVVYHEGKDMNRLENTARNYAEFGQIRSEYIQHLRTIVDAILNDPEFKSLSFSVGENGGTYVVKRGADNTEALSMLELAIQQDNLLCSVSTKGLNTYSLYLRSRNFLKQSNGNVVIIDPF